MIQPPNPNPSSPRGPAGPSIAGPILAIETSNPTAQSATPPSSIAIVEPPPPGKGEPAPARTLIHLPIEPSDRHDDALLPTIADACERAAIERADLTGVAVSLGPGGYTACRTAAVAAQCIAESLNIPAYPVPTCLALALAHTLPFPPQERQQPTSSHEQLCILLAWKRRDVWRHRFHVDPHTSLPHPLTNGELVPLANPLGPPSTSPTQPDPTGPASKPDTAIIADRRTMQAIADASPTMSPNELLALPHHSPRFDAVAVALAAIAGLVRPVDPVQILPIYPRDPEAVTSWRARKLGRER